MDSRLEDAFAKGSFIRPAPDRADLVHLVRAIAILTGVRTFKTSPPIERLAGLIGPSSHYIFILLDGLGMNIVRKMPRASFIASHLREQIAAISPATTACALTSVATGVWPARHAITGWFTHLPEFGLTSTILPFTERYTQRPLAERGLTAKDVLPVPPFYSEMNCHCLTLMPAQILNTTYALYSRGYTPGAGYASIADAVDQIIAHVSGARTPTYTHLYVPDIDSLCHKKGATHASVLDLVSRIDIEIARLAHHVVSRARIIICADHGLIDIAPADHMPIFDGDPALDMLQAPPSGDARMPLFHVKPDRRQDFVELFQKRFARSFALIDMDEVERMRLFGPPPMSEIAKRRFGDFVGVAVRPATLLYHPPAPPTQATREPYIAQHAGLSRDEMLIPLVIA